MKAAIVKAIDNKVQVWNAVQDAIIFLQDVGKCRVNSQDVVVEGVEFFKDFKQEMADDWKAENNCTMKTAVNAITSFFCGTDEDIAAGMALGWREVKRAPRAKGSKSTRPAKRYEVPRGAKFVERRASGLQWFNKDGKEIKTK